MTDELATATKKSSGFFNILIKIVVIIAFFAVGGVGLALSACGVDVLVRISADLISFPTGKNLIAVGSLYLMFALPSILIFGRICFFAWKLAFVPSDKPHKVSNTVARIFMELGYWVGAILAFPCLWSIIAMLSNYKQEFGIQLVVALVFFFLGAWIMIIVNRGIKQFNKRMEDTNKQQ